MAENKTSESLNDAQRLGLQLAAEVLRTVASEIEKNDGTALSPSALRVAANSLFSNAGVLCVNAEERQIKNWAAQVAALLRRRVSPQPTLPHDDRSVTGLQSLSRLTAEQRHRLLDACAHSRSPGQTPRRFAFPGFRSAADTAL